MKKTKHMNDLLNILCDAILTVYDENGKELVFKKKEIKPYRAKYSSVLNDTITLFLDDVPLTNTKNKKQKVMYKCSCGTINTILLCRYLKKNRLACHACREKDVEKIAWHKKYFEMKRNGKTLERKKRDYEKNADRRFENESDEFKKDYFRRNLTEEEFRKVQKYIYSIGNIVVDGRNDYDLLIAEKAPNAKLYSQKVNIDGKIIPFKNIYLRCPLCDEVFHITRQLKERVNANNFDCRKCFLNNKTFAIKKYGGTYLTFQGELERKFIERCFLLGLEIVNGPKISYEFENKTHVYTTDFLLPEFKCVIELKDNHVWHRKQVKSGKWGNKEKAAKTYCEENDLTFHLLFPKDIEGFFEKIKNK